MRRLTYWIARVRNDSDCYSIRAPTRREVRERLAAINDETPGWADTHFEAPRKVSVEYQGVFDLLDQCLSGEARGWWEAEGADDISVIYY